MHTETIEADGVTYYVHHNSNWTGEAIISWKDPGEGRREVKLPAPLLAACGRREAMHAAITLLESLY